MISLKYHKNKIARQFLIVTAFFVGTCAEVLAQSNVGGGQTNIGGGNVNSGTGGGTGSLVNPLQSTSITEFLGKIVDIIIIFATPIIVLFIMYGGYLLVTARGNPGEIEKGKSAITYAVLGGVIVFGARLIISVVEGTVKSI